MAKLGNALFAFYLVRKIVASLSNNQAPQYNWPAFREQLDRCMARPGAHWVRKAVAVSKQVCDEKGWSAVSLRLDSMNEIDGVLDFKISAMVRTDDKLVDLGREAEQRHAGEFGRLWLFFSERVRRMLCMAEARFERDSKSLGLAPVDYGSMAVDYAKIFEIELDARLRDIHGDAAMQFFLSHQVRGWKVEQGPPTLGSYILMLERAGDMPEELLSYVQTKVGTLHADKQLLGELRKMKDMRNRGAHTGEVSAADITGMREMLYSRGMIRRFLEAISGARKCA